MPPVVSLAACKYSDYPCSQVLATAGENAYAVKVKAAAEHSPNKLYQGECMVCRTSVAALR